jgi:hypothetical protein
VHSGNEPHLIAGVDDLGGTVVTLPRFDLMAQLERHPYPGDLVVNRVVNWQVGESRIGLENGNRGGLLDS